MADYFTNFSLILPLPSKEAQAYALDLHAQARGIYQGEEKPDNFPKSLLSVAEDYWNFDTEPDEPGESCDLWLHSEYGGIDAVCAFIQHLLRKFNPTGHLGFEWSHDCSRPRTDAYGGGAALVTARTVKVMNTGDWLHKKTASCIRV